MTTASRADTLRKLLALGQLTRSELRLYMGGDEKSIQDAVNELVKKRVAMACNWGFGRQIICLTPAGQKGVFQCQA
jgi:hypothetical protein